MSSAGFETAEKWYASTRPQYELLAKEVSEIIRKILTSKIDFHDIRYRAKSPESFQEKLSKGVKYSYKEMQDLAGVRIITHVNSDASIISNIVSDTFEIDWKRSRNRSIPSSTDIVGYKSIHYVARLKDERIKLPDFEAYKNMFFEIQIRTILQHAWAEIEHNNNYKFPGKLRSDLQRRFYLVAGTLEMLDNEFQSILNEIEIYKKEISERTKKGDLNIPIDSTSLLQYMLDKFGAIYGISPQFGIFEDTSAESVNNLNLLGIKTLAQLDEIVPPGLKQAYAKRPKVAFFTQKYTYLTLINQILIAKDPEAYFKIIRQGVKGSLLKTSFEVLREIGVNEEVLLKYWIIVPDPMLSTNS